MNLLSIVKFTMLLMELSIGKIFRKSRNKAYLDQNNSVSLQPKNNEEYVSKLYKI